MLKRLFGKQKVTYCPLCGCEELKPCKCGSCPSHLLSVSGRGPDPRNHRGGVRPKNPIPDLRSPLARCLLSELAECEASLALTQYSVEGATEGVARWERRTAAIKQAIETLKEAGYVGLP